MAPAAGVLMGETGPAPVPAPQLRGLHQEEEGSAHLPRSCTLWGAHRLCQSRSLVQGCCRALPRPGSGGVRKSGRLGTRCHRAEKCHGPGSWDGTVASVEIRAVWHWLRRMACGIQHLPGLSRALQVTAARGQVLLCEKREAKELLPRPLPSGCWLLLPGCGMLGSSQSAAALGSPAVGPGQGALSPCTLKALASLVCVLVSGGHPQLLPTAFWASFRGFRNPKTAEIPPIPCAGKRRDWSGVSSRDMDVFPLCSRPSGCTHVGLALHRHRPWQKNTPSVPSPAQCPPAETSASLGQGALADVPGCRCPGAQGKRS